MERSLRLDLVASGWALGMFLDHTKFFPLSVPLYPLLHLSGKTSSLVTQFKHHLLSPTQSKLDPWEYFCTPLFFLNDAYS